MIIGIAAIIGAPIAYVWFLYLSGWLGAIFTWSIFSLTFLTVIKAVVSAGVLTIPLVCLLVMNHFIQRAASVYGVIALGMLKDAFKRPSKELPEEK